MWELKSPANTNPYLWEINSYIKIPRICTWILFFSSFEERWKLPNTYCEPWLVSYLWRSFLLNLKEVKMNAYAQKNSPFCYNSSRNVLIAYLSFFIYIASARFLHYAIKFAAYFAIQLSNCPFIGFSNSEKIYISNIFLKVPYCSGLNSTFIFLKILSAVALLKC